MKQFNTDTEEMDMAEDYKPTYIHEQHNNNCQQFFGPITNCTFTMPAAKPSSSRKPKAAKQKNADEKKLGGKPMTLKYYKHGNNGVLKQQRQRVDIVFRLWERWGWIGDTKVEDFDRFFEGEPRHCNITWTANTTILTILLQELISQPYIEKQTGLAAKSMVKQQFGKTDNSSRSRLDNVAEKRIKLTLLILDYNNPLPEKQNRHGDSEYDIQDAALYEIYDGQLRNTKGI